VYKEIHSLKQCRCGCDCYRMLQ